MIWKTISAAAIATALTLGVPASFAQAAQPDDILGTWQSETVKLEFFKAGAEYNARILWGNRIVESDGVTFKKDILNPDPAFRSRSLQGITMVTGLVYQNGEWTGGSLYDGSSGRTYSGKAEIADGKLHLRGYLGVPAMGQTMVLQKAPAAPSGTASKSSPAKR
ncbi:DUF2147 domain-containing protein [Bradyrhizobium neotropicale]|uniref:DUF2147 domain-containing protein n=1 Tax=Bradyrhizobium neotropicale TaxID=1497615 RepID=UPI001AD63DA9|nr:DUF2147 domain-containing protein [Bradyrhizobium neotropicale]MBO4226825.1 DUF2147 domain-containing protein [Bradyrhizobium neotropicale]